MYFNNVYIAIYHTINTLFDYYRYKLLYTHAIIIFTWLISIYACMHCKCYTILVKHTCLYCSTNLSYILYT